MKTIPEEIQAQLGEKPDSVLADQCGVSTETIRRLRLSRNIKASKQYVEWTPEMDALLGTESDAKVAKKLGVTKMATLLRRQRLGKEPSRPITLKYQGNDASIGVVALTAHVSEEVRLKAHALREPVLAMYKSAGLPMREVTMWQVIEFAVNKLHREMIEGCKG